MSLLSNADINRMRDTVEETLAGTAVIQTSAFVSDGGGGGTTTYTASGTVGCHLAPILRGSETGGRELTIGGRLSPDAQWVVTLPAETTITREDRVVIAGTTYNVVATHAPRTWELSRRIEVNEVT